MSIALETRNTSRARSPGGDRFTV